jgi:hypothetical protein
VLAGARRDEFGTAAVPIVEGEPPAGPVERFDENGDGEISTPELQAAVRAWIDGEIPTDDLTVIVGNWTEN